MNAIWKFVWRCKTLIFPLFVLTVAVMVLFMTRHPKAAYVVSNLGTIVILTANTIFIVAFDSRKRWPNDTWSGRLRKLFSFQR